MKNNINYIIQSIAAQIIALYDHPSEQHQVAWWILEGITGKSQAELLAIDTLDLTDQQKKKLNQWIDEHVNKKKPLQYILGTVPFNEVKIKVRPPILIPRPETEEWVVNLIKQLKKIDEPFKILDIGTGSGAIALALAKALKKSEIYATDINEHALALARENAAYNKISNVVFIQSDVFNSLDAVLKFDLIVSNPPYISQQEWDSLDPMVSTWEDKKALVASDNGLGIIKKIIDQSHLYVKPNKKLYNAGIGQLYIEIGYTQADAVRQLMRQAGYHDIKIVKDLEGKDRVVSGRIDDKQISAD